MEDIARKSSKTRYLTPYVTGNTANLDSLRSRSRYPVLNSGNGMLWGSHTHLTARRLPTFDSTFVRLSDSGDTQRWLAANPDGSEMKFVPTDGSTPVSRVVASGAIVLVQRDPDTGMWTILIPRTDSYIDLSAGDDELPTT